MIADINAAIALLALILGAVNAAALIFDRFRRPSSAKFERLECEIVNHAALIDKHDSRIQTVEGEIRHLPTSQQFHDLGLQLASLSGSMRALETEMGGVARSARRMEEHLIAGKS